MVPHQEGVFHRTRGDDEGLHERRRAEKKQQNGDRPFGNSSTFLLRFFNNWRRGRFGDFGFVH